MRIPALIYAAGLGTRMKPLTNDRPKPLIRVAGKTLLDHAFSALNHTQISNIVINTHYKSEMIHATPFPRDVQFSHEKMLLETGGGLKQAISSLGGNPVVTLNSDAVWKGENPVSFLMKHWREDMDALLLVVKTDAAVGHVGTGDFNIDAETVLSNGTQTVYTGLQVIRTELFEKEEANVFSTRVVWEKMLARRTMHGVVYSGQWCDVGCPASIPLAEAMLQRKESR